MSHYVWFEKQPGILRIHLFPEMKRDLKVLLKEEKSWFGKWAEVLEYQLCNGWTQVDTSQIALWDDCQMLITEDMEEDDQKRILRLGVCYTYDFYQIRDELKVLRDQGYVDYTEIDLSDTGEDDDL